jgi:hypothetical protein
MADANQLPPSAPLENFIRINGTNSTPEAQLALQRIAENLRARNVNLQADDSDLAQEFAILTKLSALEVQLQMRPSHIPLIGGLVTRVKQALHQLVLFYVRDLAAQQNAFNAQLVRILSKIGA